MKFGLVVVALLAAAGLLWNHSRLHSRHARILMLDPRTGRTLHEWSADGGYAVAALLANGRVAVATLDSCIGGKGGSVTVLDRTLTRVVSRAYMAPCTVARIGAGELRAYFREPSGTRPRETGTDMRIAFTRGIIVEGRDLKSPLQDSDRLTRYDEAGRLVWRRRSFGGFLGAVDARQGRIVVPVLGDFTPGAD